MIPATLAGYPCKLSGNITVADMAGLVMKATNQGIVIQEVKRG